MTITVTEHFGFIGVYNAVPSTNDWACTYWNWIAADQIFYGLIQHTHDGAAALQNPTGTLSLSTAVTGGYLPANTTYYIAVTYVDAIMRETAASDVAEVTTGAGISTPATPTIDDDATPTDIQTCPGGLSGGDYWYKIAYTKDGGESLPSSPVYVQIPTDDTYECTIHFVSLNDAANGADSILVYRKSGSSGSYVKLAEITAGSTSSYTDDNTGVPTCDKNPVASSTISSFNTITIDWSSLDFTEAEYIKIYATTTEGTYPTNALVATVTMNDATPVTEYIWTGIARTAGKPPEVTQCFGNPPKINLASHVTGNLPWANLPSDFNWLEPVATATSLPTGTNGDVCLVEDEDKLYTFDGDAATPAWVEIGGTGIDTIDTYDELPSDGFYYHSGYDDLIGTKACNTSYDFADDFLGQGEHNYIFKFKHEDITNNTVTVEIHADDGGKPAATALHTKTELLNNPSGTIETEFDFGLINLTDSATYWVTLSYDTNSGNLLSSYTGSSMEKFGVGEWTPHAGALSFDLEITTEIDNSKVYLNLEDNTLYGVNESSTAFKKITIPVITIAEQYDSDNLEAYLPADNSAGDLVLIKCSASNGGFANYELPVFLYLWRGDWSTPGWQLLNSFLPFIPEGEPSYLNAAAPAGTIWLQNIDGDLCLFARHPDGYATVMPISTYLMGDFIGYLGYSEDDPGWAEEPNYGYGAVTFYWNDKSFYYYDDEIATPAWVRGPGVVKLDTTIDDMNSATPSAEETKINEILQALRDSGLISS